MTQRIINDPTTKTSKSKINQLFGVKTGNQLALKLLKDGVDLLTASQLNLNNSKLIKEKQIQNAYAYAKTIFNNNVLQKRTERKQAKKQGITYYQLVMYLKITKKIRI